MIKVSHLTKRYGGLEAVCDLSFEVQQNEVLGFLGPNGAGKSTTLKILTGFLPASSGTVMVDDTDVYVAPEKAQQVIGYLPENVPLYGDMRVDEYLSYRAALKKVPRQKRKEAVAGVIERCEIGDVRRKIIGHLSKGFRQRVGLADALVGDPRILVLDEPTIGLDPNQIRQVRDLIHDLGKERTVILSSHILPEVEAVCSRVLILNRGRMVGQGKPAELRKGVFGEHSHITVEVRDPNSVAAKCLAAIEGIEGVEDATPRGEGTQAFLLKTDASQEIREQIFDAAVSSGFKLIELSFKTVSLEDVFVQITTGEQETQTEPSEQPDPGGQGEAK